MKQTVLVLVLTVAPILCATAGDLTEQYTLKQRCGEQVAKAFRDGGDKEGITSDSDWIKTTSYEAHFNLKSLKCFMFYSMDSTPRHDKKRVRTTFRQAFEVNENKSYAELTTMDGAVMSCSVGDARCHTVAEWESMTKALMGE